MRMMNCLELADADHLVEVALDHAQQTSALVSIAVVAVSYTHLTLPTN